MVWEDFSEEGNGNTLQCCCLENTMDRGAWRAKVHGITESWTRWKWLSCSNTARKFQRLERELSTVLSKDNHHPFKYTNRKRGAKAVQFQKRSLLSASFTCGRKVLKIGLSPEDFILTQSGKSLLFLPLGYTPQTTPLSMALPLLFHLEAFLVTVMLFILYCGFVSPLGWSASSLRQTNLSLAGP